MIKQGFISDPSISLSPIHKPRNSPSPSPSPSSSPSSKPLTVSPPSAFSRPTLFEMMSEEQLRESKQSTDNNRRRLQDKLARVLSKNPNFVDSNNCSSNNLGCFGDGDVKLTVSGRDGFKISMDVHRKVLADKSRFFAEKLRDGGITHSVEICDCDDVEIYVETLVLMYSDDLKKKLMGEDVSRILGLLKVSAAILFEDGILSCLDYLEAVPWSEEEEEKIISCLSQLQLHDSVSEDVLQRVSTEPSTSARADDMFMKMLTGVLHAKTIKLVEK